MYGRSANSILTGEKFMIYLARLEKKETNRFHEAKQKSLALAHAAELGLPNFRAWRNAAAYAQKMQAMLGTGKLPEAKLKEEPKLQAREDEIRALTTQNRFKQRCAHRIMN